MNRHMECALHCQAVLLDGWPECVVECERTKRRTSAESEQKAAGQVDDNADENRSTLERAGNGQVAEKDQAPNGSAAIAPSVDQQEVRPAPAATLPDEGQWVPREPTQEQMIAGAEVKQPNGLISLHGAAAIYQAMLAAVPASKEGEGNG